MSTVTIGFSNITQIIAAESLSTLQPSITQPATPNQFVTSSTAPTLREQDIQSLYVDGQYEEAAQAWQSLAVYYQLHARPLDQIKALNNAALAYRKLGHWSTASDAVNNSLTLLKSPSLLSPGTVGYAAAAAQTYNTDGLLQLAQVQPLAALANFEQATGYYQQAENPVGAVRSQINQALALQHDGRYRQAANLLINLNKSLINSTPAFLQAVSWRTLGQAQLALSQLDQADQSFQHSLHVATQLEDPGAIAQAHLGLANVALARGQLNTAVATQQQALTQATELYQQVLNSSAPQDIKTQAQLKQFEALAAIEQFEPTAQQLKQLKAGLFALPPGRSQNYALLNWAELLLETQKPAYVAQVAPLLKRTLSAAQDISDRRAESYALGLAGQLAADQGQLTEAETLTTAALQAAEAINALEVSYRWQWQLGKLFEQENDRSSSLLEYRAAVQTLKTLRERELAGISSDVQFNFRKRVEPVYRDLVSLLLQGPNTPPEAIVEARDTIEALQIAELENFFREACLTATELEIDRVIEQANQSTAAIYPILLDDRLEVIVQLPGQDLFHASTPVSQAELSALIQTLRYDLRLPYTLRSVQGQAQQLYNWLLKPVQKQLAEQQIDTLVFILDGPLRNIPMGLLYDGDRYLIEDYSVAVAPSLRLVDPQRLADQDLAAIAAGLSEARHDFSSLQFVDVEVSEVAEQLPGRLLLNETFTQSSFAKALEQTSYPIVHLATHGQFSSDPEQTFILAWDQPIKLDTLNQMLRSSSLSREQAIELLVLSACQTAAGDERAALGLAGVAVRAGARSTLASLWNLDDETSSVLMDSFYEALQTSGITKAAALRQAQLDLLNNPGYQHPRYWAPFVLVGNWL
ncbi:MAG: CHAT domain-containing protein [Cyanobacteria bacterium P01_H01_bin.121]